MPTPVSSARPLLSASSSSALSSAVSSARRRHHPQTTSLHLISSLLLPHPPSPLLRDALSRSPSNSRLHHQALELCFSVALDRLPSHRPSANVDESSVLEPPLSNSLMAAIKRSQANQRRNPDSFHMYQLYSNHNSKTVTHDQSGSATSPVSSTSTSAFSGVKVELQQLLLAVLDDPIVSRVFGDAGFRSCDIKISLLRPPLRFPRQPSLFMCGDGSTTSGPRFPFSNNDVCGDDNCRRIGDVLSRGNAVLVGVGAADAAKDFAVSVREQKWGVLPVGLHGVKLVEVDVREKLNLVVGNGVVVSVGDLKGLVEDGGEELVPELTRVMEGNKGRVWVMGWSGTYEGYMKFLARYPELDKAWDLQLLPISAQRTGVGALLPRSYSMMESFVPFGGFFPATYEPKILLTKPQQSPGRCQDCNDYYEQEVASIQKGCLPSIGNRDQTSMPAWLRNAGMGTKTDELGLTKAKDDRYLLSAKMMDLQKKWDDNCQRLHRGCQITEADNIDKLSDVGLQFVSNKERTSNLICKNPRATENQSICGNVLPATPSHFTKANQSISLPLPYGNEGTDLISKLQLRLSKSEHPLTDGLLSQQGALTELFVHGDSDSPCSVTSVTTDLVLGTPMGPSRKEVMHTSVVHLERLKEFSECLPSKKIDEFRTSAPEVRQSYPCSHYLDPSVKDKYLPRPTLLNSKDMSANVSAPDQRFMNSSNTCKAFDPTNFKMFYASLIEKVRRQEEALRAITEAVVSCRAGHGRRHGVRLKGDIWLSFHGQDRMAKKRAAMALAELVFGSKENFISINLGCQDGFCSPNTICNQQGVNEYDLSRGKTIVDHIAEEVSKNPWSVVFLENVDKADFLVQKSLLQAINTGKLSNSYGREFNINNAIFVTTTTNIFDKTFPQGNECVNFSEERILGAQGWKMKLLLESISEASGSTSSFDVSVTSSPSVNKRKLSVSNDKIKHSEFFGTSKRVHRSLNTFLDLNLPVEEAVASDTDSSSSDESNPEAWLEEFFNLMDATVQFKQFDFDVLADRVLREISKSLRSTTGCKCTLEIDLKAMEQILAATWLLDDTEELNNWLDNVLVTSLVELRQKYNLSTRIALKLIAWDGVPMDSAPEIRLPSSITVE